MSPMDSAWRARNKRVEAATLTRRIVLSSLLQFAPAIAVAGKTPAPKDAYLYIIWPTDGERIRGAFWCRFGLRNMGITHAGDATPNMGHHHLFIDADEPLDLNEPIPSNKNHLHFGAGQTEVRLDLPPGPRTLQLVLGDSEHIPFDPPVVSKKIRIVVT
jgi:Domain of unknown function (DUF4399)